MKGHGSFFDVQFKVQRSAEGGRFSLKDFGGLGHVLWMLAHLRFIILATTNILILFPPLQVSENAPGICITEIALQTSEGSITSDVVTALTRGD